MNSKEIFFKEAAKKLLALTGEPMTPKEIAALTMDEGFIKTTGETPAASYE